MIKDQARLYLANPSSNSTKSVAVGVYLVIQSIGTKLIP